MLICLTTSKVCHFFDRTKIRWKSPDSCVSDRVLIVRKKSHGKILSFEEVRARSPIPFFLALIGQFNGKKSDDMIQNSELSRKVFWDTMFPGS